MTPRRSICLTGARSRHCQDPDTGDIDNGNLRVAWSADGETLFAAGGTNTARGDGIPGRGLVRRRPGARRELPASSDTIMSLAPLPDGDLLVAAPIPISPYSPNGSERWVQRPSTG